MFDFPSPKMLEFDIRAGVFCCTVSPLVHELCTIRDEHFGRNTCYSQFPHPLAIREESRVTDAVCGDHPSLPLVMPAEGTYALHRLLRPEDGIMVNLTVRHT